MSKLPDTIVAAYGRANTYLPQFDPGLTIFVGKATMDACLKPGNDGQKAWNAIVGSQPSRDQIAQLHRALITLHEKAGVHCQPIIGDFDIRLRSLLNTTIQCVTFAARIYTADTCSTGVTALRNDNVKQIVGEILFGGANGEPRPQAQALQRMWHAAEGALTSPEGQIIADEHKARTLAAYRAHQKLDPIRTATTEALTPIVQTAMAEALPLIKAETGFAVPEQTAHDFMVANDLQLS